MGGNPPTDARGWRTDGRRALGAVPEQRVGSKVIKRFLAEGEAGLVDRSSRPHRSLNRTPVERREAVVAMRRQHRWGATHIGHELTMAAATVRAISRAEGLGRLDRGARATATEPIRRYERDRPGELVHVDVKKTVGIPPGGGWRIHGRGNAPDHRRSKAGYRFIHTVSMTAPASPTPRPH